MNSIHAKDDTFTSVNMLKLAILLFISLITFTIYFFESHVKEDVLGAIDNELIETNQRLSEILTSSIQQSKSDLRFLHSTPPISGLPRAHYNNGIDPYDGTTYLQWKERLETIFIGFLENNLAIEQIRLIEVSTEGKEILRVQRVDAAVEAVPDHSLQAKSGESYFLPSSQLEVNQIYMSNLSLNREFGEIQFPYKPMLRLSIPIYSEKGKRFAFLIMNVNANKLLSNFKDTIFDYAQLVISSSEGDIIIHPIEDFQYTLDLNPEVTWDTLFNKPIQYNTLYKINALQPHHATFYVHSHKVVIRPQGQFGYVNFNVMVPEPYIAGLINGKRFLTYSLLIIVVIFTAILLFTFYMSAKRSHLLAETRREASAIVDGSIDAILGLDLNGNLTSLNNSAERLLFISKMLAVGKPWKDLKLLSKLPIEQYIKDIINSKAQIKDEYSSFEKEEKQHFAISISPVTSEQNKLIGLALIIRDISKEKEADIKVKRLNSELEAKVRERTKALSDAKDEAIKHSEIKSSFISNVSHEIRTPLNAVVGSLCLLRREKLSENAHRLIHIMEQSTSSLSVLINDIIDLSKVESGKLDLNKQQVNVSALIESLVESCSVKAFEKGLEVLIDTSELHLSEIETDPLRLTQILNNLISNAIKFTEHGYIKIKVKSEIITGDQYKLIVNVIDSGIGIEPLAQNCLFNAFQRRNRKLDQQNETSGLGLSICKQLCQIMGGDIKVRSKEQQGSDFEFHISVTNLELPEQQTLHSFPGLKVALLSSDKQLQENLGIIISAFKASFKVISNEDLISINAADINLLFIDFENFEINNSAQFEQKSLYFTVVYLHQPSNPVPKSLLHKSNALAKPITRTKVHKVILGEKPAETPMYCLPFESEKAQIIQQEGVNKISGCKVLVVDDNEINIEFVNAALDNLGVEFLSAANGEMALELLKEQACKNIQIHCVLMDCQMPVMNGFELCERIRSGEVGDAIRNVPIIAMSASAMKEERQRCLNIGMNDFISKPLASNALKEKVLKWTLSNFDTLEETQLHLQESSNEEGLWNKSEVLARLLNKEVLLKKVCEMFIVKAPVRLQELKCHIEQGNREQIRQTAHALKGMCGELSAVNLRALCASIEEKASLNNLELDEEWSEVERMLPSLIKDIRNWLDTERV